MPEVCAFTVVFLSTFNAYNLPKSQTLSKDHSQEGIAIIGKGSPVTNYRVMTFV